MSTQPTELPELPELQNQETQPVSLLDGPWKVTILPDEPEVPTAPTQVKIGPNGELLQWLPAPDPNAVKSQPWRRGDVTRLKDDSPRGMMEYIATHTKGWWQELAERALRDNEKAERLVREAGWQPGQCWALEVDAEAKQKLLEAEEAKRQREEAERAKEAAEKEAFLQRQMELLKKAGRAPRCEYLYTDGRGCRAPQVKGERWCHGHAKAMSYRPEKLEMELMEDEQAVMVNLYRVTRSLLAGRISEKTAGLMLWSVAIGAPGATRVRKAHRGGAETRRKSSPLINTENSDERKINPGVTNRKSIKSGVEGRVSPPAKATDLEPRENALKRHGRTEHSRDVSTLTPAHKNRVRRRPQTPPHSPSQAQGRSESLNMTRGEGRRDASEHRQVSNKSQSSASPCLRGRFHALQNGQAGL